MSAIERVKAHYSRQEIRKLHVPEWEMDVYCKPLNMEDQARINSLSDGDQAMYYPMAIVQCALDEDGNKLFGLGDSRDMATKADAAVVTRVGLWIFSGASEEVDHEKNS